MHLVADGVLYGPMHSKEGVEMYKAAVKEAVAKGGKIEFGGNVSWSYTYFNSLTSLFGIFLTGC